MRSFPPLPEFVELEHQVANILQLQEEHGWFFDEKAARELELTLRKELSDTTKILQDRFPYAP